MFTVNKWYGLTMLNLKIQVQRLYSYLFRQTTKMQPRLEDTLRPPRPGGAAICPGIVGAGSIPASTGKTVGETGYLVIG